MRINCVGDLCMAGIEEDNFHIDERIIARLRRADLNVANLESPLTRSEKRIAHQPIYLKGEPRLHQLLDLFDVFSLANNHIMDFGEEGLSETISFLTSAKKQFFGAGRTRTEASEPLLVEGPDVKLAFLGFTRFNAATRRGPGTAPDRQNRLRQAVWDLSQSGYFVVVCPHWNYQWVDYPAPDERKKAKGLIDAGADIIVGAHPHIVQGIEEYRGKYIFHSLGNFVFKRTKFSRESPKLGRTFILELDVRSDRSYEAEITPVFSDSPGMRLMDGREEEEFRAHLNEISGAFQDDRVHRALFYATAATIDKHTGSVFKEMRRRKRGLQSVIHSYRVANKQDVKKRLYSLFSRAFGR